MKSALWAAVLLSTTLSAQAGGFSFDDVPLGNIAGDSLTLSTEGVSVTFSGPGLLIRDLTNLGAGYALSTAADAGPITVTFGGGFVADSVAFFNPLHVGGHEIDVALGVAYDTSGAEVARLLSGSALHYLGGGGISYVVYTEGAQTFGFTMGDFQFNVPAPPIPEPSQAVLMIPGLLALAACRRRARAD
ncbi:MAG: hypothetical protein K2Q07_00610 [Burkholderiaceae bacterium]|nr:hypothetical protein [Burkholderiaceae bacterium]